MNDQLKLVLWNVEWAKPGHIKANTITALIEGENPDVICLTEGREGMLKSDWHCIWSEQDPGYRTDPDQRKVILASRNKWHSVDSFGNHQMPPGRFVCATTDTPVGPITFIAICIPWSHAHVTSGQKNRKAWEEHHRFLDGLELFLSSSVFETPVVLLGNFNQRVPRKRSPITAYNRLMEVTGKQFSFLTSGHIATENALSIDHVCVSSALSG